MTKTTGQRIKDEWISANFDDVAVKVKAGIDLSSRIDQALETANAEVTRLKRQIADATNILDNVVPVTDPEVDPDPVELFYAVVSRVKLAREALDKKE